MIIHRSQVQVLGFDYLKELYETDVDFQNVFEACQHPVNKDNIPWKEFMLQDGLLLKKIHLYVLHCSMRENII